MLNVARLRVLKEVAYRGSFSAAAEALSYTQSAISQQIATLEAETGMALLERHPRGVTLTAAGQTLVGHAEGILARLDAAEASLAAIAGLRGGRLRMASFPTAGATLMPLAIATFRASLPRRRADARRGRAGGDRAAPARRRARPRAAVRVRRREHARTGELTRVELLSDPMYLALPREHPLAARARDPPRGPRRRRLGADLAREPLRAPRRAQLPQRRLRAAT